MVRLTCECATIFNFALTRKKWRKIDWDTGVCLSSVNLLVDELALRTSAVVGALERTEAPGEGGCGVELPQSADLWSVLFRTRGRH